MINEVLVTLTAARSEDRPATAQLTIENFKFAPDPITISVGASVLWTNNDPAGHNAQAHDKSFRTPLFLSGDSALSRSTPLQPSFASAAPTPEMVGTVIVEPASSG